MKTRNSTILITGGTSGIGRALAVAFVARGNRVIVTGRDRARGAELAAAHPGLDVIYADLSTSEGAQQIVDAVREEHPTIDTVIHMAGIMRDEDWTETPPIEVAEAVVATNLLAPLRLTAGLLPLLRARPRATIVMVSSGLAFVPMAAVATYSATKAAIHSLSQSLREQLRETSVEVLEIIPPYVATTLMGDAQASDPHAMPLDAFVDEVMTLLGSEPTPAEINVQRVLPLRHAEARGPEAFAKVFGMLNSRAMQPWKST